MPSAKLSWAPVNSSQRSKCSSDPPCRSARRRAVATPLALSFAPGTGSDSVMSTSSGTCTIRTTVGTNWSAVRTCPSMPGMRSAAHATTATIDQNSGASGGEEQAAAVDEAGAGGVVVGDQHQRALLAAVLDGYHVLRRAPAGEASEQVERSGGVPGERREHDGGDGGAEDRLLDRQHAAHDRQNRVQRERQVPGGEDADRLDDGLPPELREPALEVPGGTALGVAPGHPEADADERLDVAFCGHEG